MSLFTIAFIFVGSVCFSLGFIHLLIFVLRRDIKANLFFSLMSFAIAFSSFFEIWAFKTASLADYIPLLKGTLFVQIILWITFTWFVYFYTKSKITWLPALVTALYLIALIVNFFSPGSVLFRSVEELTSFSFWSDEIIYLGNGPANPLRIVGDIAWFLLVAYAAVTTYGFAKREDLKKAVVFGTTVFLCLGLGYLHGTLIDLGMADPPYLGSFLFLPLTMVMSFSLAGEVARASKLSKDIEVAESRWRHLLEHVHLLVVGIDHKSNIFYVNPYFMKVTGYKESDLLGEAFIKVIPDQSRSEIESRLVEVLQEGNDIKPERTLSVLTKQGETREILWSNTIFEQQHKDESRLLSIGKDITDQLLAEHSRDQAIQELEDLKVKLEAENISLQEIIQLEHGFDEIVGQSNQLLYVLGKIKQIAQTDSTVLILGETGTGKELVAKAIHKESKRRSKPFIRVNCAAIPSDLIENELFGHEPGAFTSATSLHRGKFELANHGSLFLDEIGEMPIAIQAKLLNVLQDREITRVGGTNSIPIDVHIIAATNRDLEVQIKNGRFRADLYYRLNVYPITVPSLRSRKEDISILIKHFIAIFNKQFGRNVDSVAPDVLEKLQLYEWPGNIRELRNLVERAVITSESNVLQLPSDMLSQEQNNTINGETSNSSILPLIEMERKHILRALQRTGWQVSGPNGAARLLKMNPSTLRSRIKKHRLEKS